MTRQPISLFAAAREAKDPRVTVTSLRAAVDAGKLPHTTGIGGRTLVKMSDVKRVIGFKRTVQIEKGGKAKARH